MRTQFRGLGCPKAIVSIYMSVQFVLHNFFACEFLFLIVLTLPWREHCTRHPCLYIRALGTPGRFSILHALSFAFFFKRTALLCQEPSRPCLPPPLVLAWLSACLYICVLHALDHEREPKHQFQPPTSSKMTMTYPNK